VFVIVIPSGIAISFFKGGVFESKNPSSKKIKIRGRGVL
jgi:hypothetical protein